jgi:putative phosphoesterase
LYIYFSHFFVIQGLSLMKIGLLCDIHGNHLALHAALNAAAAADVECLLVGGDLVGYYFEPLRVWEMLRTWDFHAVRGNHEDMLERAYVDPTFLATVDARYGSGLRVTIEQFSSDNISLLLKLPTQLHIQLNNCSILLCHGSPWDNNKYVYPDAPQELLDNCASSKYDFVILGHTHYPMIKKVGNTVIVNPGSVGQPRNRVLGAHWALLDTDTRTINLHCEQYDASSLVKEAKKRHPDIPYLSEILEKK